MVEKVYLVRHGHIDTGGEKRYVGQSDIPLDALGVQQAQQLADSFKTIAVDTVFTSPLRRCVQTTEILGKAYQVVEAFQEINMGAWENRPIERVKAYDSIAFEERGRDIEHFTPPQGESFGALSQRVLNAFDTLVERYHGTVLIVAHAGVNRVILRELLGIPFKDIFSIEQAYACINELVKTRHDKVWKYQKIV